MNKANVDFWSVKMSFKAGNFDVAVIGAGHAGIEAALAAAHLGCNTAVFTILSIGWEICHATLPSEVPQRDTLSEKSTHSAGEMGRAADKNLIQSRMLNRGKGPAVHSLRGRSTDVNTAVI